MKQRYREIDHALIVEAVSAWGDGKWKRRDVLTVCEEWAGIPRHRMIADETVGNMRSRCEAAENLALSLGDLITEIVETGTEDRIASPAIHQRHDGMAQKTRNITILDPWHQMLGHVCALALAPLFHARLLPQQHASIPGRGQTGLKRQVAKYLRKQNGIRTIIKTDVRHAYESAQYAVICDLLSKDIPSAHDILALVRYIGQKSPGGHLAIGGYLDAWLFNYVTSFVMREVATAGRRRHGKFYPYAVRSVSYMDDIAWFARDKTSAARAVRAAKKSFARHGLDITAKAGCIELADISVERSRRHEREPVRRACPCLDMAGFEISRSHIRMRGRIFVRARRIWMRSWREIGQTGCLGIQRARRIMAYNGYLSQTDSRYIRQKYSTDALARAASATISRWERRKNDCKKRICGRQT